MISSLDSRTKAKKKNKETMEFAWDLTKVGGNDFIVSKTKVSEGFGAVAAFQNESKRVKASSDVKNLTEVKMAKKKRQFDVLSTK